MTAEQAKQVMRRRIYDADYALDAIEEIARHNGIKITCNFGAELANCHDAIAELAEYISKL